MGRLLGRGRLNGLTVFVVALLGIALVPASGCKTETVPVPGECLGVEVDGKCVPKCDPAKCKPGNTCVENECRLMCDEHLDCYDEQQACTPATDDFGNEVNVCLDTGHGRVNFFLGIGMPCPLGNECDLWGCTDGRVCHPDDPTCVGPDCKAIRYCPNGLQCDYSSCGGNPADCEKDCEGDDCNIGKCASSGERCIFNTCADAECKPMRCVRPTGTTLTPGAPGEGNPDAYCTIPDCTDDAACGPGFYCGVARDNKEICGIDVDAGVMFQNICGAPSNEPCVDPGAFNENGASYSEGSVCLLRNICRLRDECAPCETDLDCSKGLGDVCVDLAGEKVCARWCGIDGDCFRDEKCVSTEKGNVCVPRTDSCVASAAQGSKFCHHCRDDRDCGDPSNNWACLNLDGESFCFQTDFPDTCTTSADCPMAPSGARGVCLDENLGGVQPGDALYHRCYVPFGNNTGFSCWP